MLASRVESGIYYFNLDKVSRLVLDRVETEGKSLRQLFVDLAEGADARH